MIFYIFEGIDVLTWLWLMGSASEKLKNTLITYFLWIFFYIFSTHVTLSIIYPYKKGWGSEKKLTIKIIEHLYLFLIMVNKFDQKCMNLNLMQILSLYLCIEWKKLKYFIQIWILWISSYNFIFIILYF